ncbi:Acyl-CoA synthetase (AMP-forming)/AMP-acid ligase II [Paracoccus isoporae]|uniref:Acyl-CoA synthetase (AMP-forming)/AMP-acid ligase II n=1 Tax=Paracoccus isoporae TaxID=591205 RepID=A0A1G7FEU4_9RHOB|nr:AMP-binding protein [Paracoccus isoporae]SDE74075.1 Acyl-CoA synthetase (AMP-forming)/AMP-acid ligase II [Paracoccus isoporae]
MSGAQVNGIAPEASALDEAQTLRRIHELLERGAPDRIAIQDHDGREYSYGDLTRLVGEMADLLRDHGVRPGDRVMVVSENCVTFIVATLALSRLDAWALLVNARLTEAEIARLTEVADIRCALFTAEASKNARAHAEIMQASVIGRLDCGEVLVSPPRLDSRAEPVEEGSDQPGVLIYTSGTVGEPKGVVLSHGNLLFMCFSSSKLRRITPEDTTLAVLPGTHIFGLTSVFLAALARGSRLVLMSRFDAQQVLDHLAQGVTICPAVPQIFAALLRHLREAGLDTPRHSLRYIYAGGAPLDLGLKQRVEAAFGLTLHNGYGQTEAAPGISTTRLDLPREDSSVGLPIPGTEVVIHNPDEHGVGELWARGPNVMKGYYRNPEATRAALTEDGFLRTGDLARQDGDGALHIVGRLKELIVHSGFNVYPPEVEAVLTAHPAVSTSAVVGMARKGDEDVIAFVTAHSDVTEAELRDWARRHIAPYKVPARVIIAEALPQAATGKITKAKLLDHFRDQLEDEGQN